MSYSVAKTREQLPLLALALVVPAAIVWWQPRWPLLTDLHLWPLLPLWVVGGHLQCGLSYVITALSLKRGAAILRSSVLVYGKHGSLTHLLAAFLVALIEETVFRYGVLFWLATPLGNAVALVLTSLIFALAHLPSLWRRAPRRALIPHQVELFLFGLILGGLTLATRSLYPALILHTLRNYILRCLLVSKEEYAALQKTALP